MRNLTLLSVLGVLLVSCGQAATPPAAPTETTPAPVQPAPLESRRFTYFGDSIACGAGVSSPTETWWEQLRGMLNRERPNERWSYGGTCQGGAGIAWAEANLPKVAGGDVIVVFVGRNDTMTAEAFAPRYEALITTLKTRYRQVVPVVEVPTKRDGQINMDNHSPYVAIRALYPNEAVDLLREWQTNPEAVNWYADGVHQNALGQRRIAEMIVPIIR